MMLRIAIFLCLMVFSIFIIPNAFPQDEPPPKIPVIFDTDIGEDIDDTWALAFLLCSPELDLRMVTTEFNDTAAKAKIAAKFLYRLGQGHIPVGVGVKTGDFKGHQYPWAEFFITKDNPPNIPGEVDEYPGGIHADGVGAMINLINNATETITVIVAGPCPNIQEMLRRDPSIATKVNIVASMGSIYKGYGDILTPDAEYNVRKDPGAAQSLFTAPWNIKLAPLDVSSVVQIRDKIPEKDYQKLIEQYALIDRKQDEYSVEELVQLESLRESGNEVLAREPKEPYAMPLSRKPKHVVIYSLMESYRAWLKESGVTVPYDARSTTLYDTVAVYMAFSQQLLELRTLNLSVDFTGYTRITPNGKTVLTAVGWRDLKSFHTFITKRLVAGIPKKQEEEEKTGIRFKRVKLGNNTN